APRRGRPRAEKPRVYRRRTPPPTAWVPDGAADHEAGSPLQRGLSRCRRWVQPPAGPALLFPHRVSVVSASEDSRHERPRYRLWKPAGVVSLPSAIALCLGVGALLYARHG